MRRYVLIGSGIASLAAAEAIRACDPGASLVVVSREPHPFYSRPGLAYYLEGALPEAQLHLRTRAEIAALDLDRIADTVVRVDPESHTVRLAGGEVLRWDRLLLAPGAASIVPTFVPRLARGIHLLDGLDGARGLVARHRGFFTRPRAVVVGGGSTALEIVEGLHAREVETHYLLRGERYWSRVLDPAESALVEAHLERQGVVMRRGTEITGVRLDRDRIAGVRTGAGDELACTSLAVAVGVRPRTELAKAAGLEVGRGIGTTRDMATSTDGIFAAGDAAEVTDPETGRPSLDTLWRSALTQGRVAGENMAGGSAVWQPGPALNVTRLAGITTAVIGRVGGGPPDPDLQTLTRGQSERWDRLPGSHPFARSNGSDRIRVLLDAERVTGAVVMGDQEPARVLERAIRERTPLDAVRGHLRSHPEHGVTLLLEHLARTSSPSAPAGHRAQR